MSSHACCYCHWALSSALSPSTCFQPSDTWRAERRVAWSILDCARRTSTFLSCAFREQEDDRPPPGRITSRLGKSIMVLDRGL